MGVLTHDISDMYILRTYIVVGSLAPLPAARCDCAKEQALASGQSWAPDAVPARREAWDRSRYVRRSTTYGMSDATHAGKCGLNGCEWPAPL